VKGTGTVAVFGEVAGDNGLFDINFAGYTLTGTATVVPDPRPCWCSRLVFPECWDYAIGVCARELVRPNPSLLISFNMRRKSQRLAGEDRLRESSRNSALAFPGSCNFTRNICLSRRLL